MEHPLEMKAHPQDSPKKRRFVMMEPIFGHMEKRTKTDLMKPLTNKYDIPHQFLNQLMHPGSFKNADTIKFSF